MKSNMIVCVMFLLAVSSYVVAVAQNAQDPKQNLEPQYIQPNLSHINLYRPPTPEITTPKQFFYGTVGDDGVMTIIPISTIPISERIGLPCITSVSDRNNQDSLIKGICAGWHFFTVMIIVIVLLCSVV